MNLRSAGLLLLLGFALPLGAQEAPQLAEADRQRQLASFDMVWQIVRDKHWDEKLGGLDWEKVRAELRPRVEKAASAAECRAILGEMVGRLGQSHFGILPGDVYAAMEELKAEPEKKAEKPNRPDVKPSEPSAENPAEKPAKPEVKPEPKPASKPEAPARRGDGEPGFEVRVADGVALVTRVDPDTPAAKLGVKTGWIVKSVGGVELGPLLKRIAAGPHRHGVEFDLTMAVAGRLRGDVGEEVEAVFEDGEGALHKTHIRLIAPRGAPAAFGNLPAFHVRFESQKLEGDVIYASLNCFFDPIGVMPKLEKLVGDNPNAAGFILDLRGNPGGIGFMAIGIGGFFVQKSDLKLGTMFTRDANLKFVLNPREANFAGPLAILVDGCSASTSEILAGGLKDLKRARIFGTRTAGAALPSIIVRLPNGDGFQYAFANYLSEGGKPLEGHGVEPDEEAKPDRKLLLQGKDPAVEAALRWIQSQKK